MFVISILKDLIAKQPIDRPVNIVINNTYTPCYNHVNSSHAFIDSVNHATATLPHPDNMHFLTNIFHYIQLFLSWLISTVIHIIC
jgi:hypothetical protein